jgi:hypothetical protein
MQHAAARPDRTLPFFEFMLYGAKSFAPPQASRDLACVGRGRTWTLVGGSPSSVAPAARTPGRRRGHTPRPHPRARRS